MALWMDANSDPKTERERVDFDAIVALKESVATELKDKGNEYVKMGKKHYLDAIDCYTRAINQNILSRSETSTLYANRSHVNLLLGNYRRALNDAEDEVKLSHTNVKAHYRAAKAALSLDLITEAISFCDGGLEQLPTSQELKTLLKKIDLKKREVENHKAEVAMALETAEDLLSAILTRKLKMGNAVYQELTGMRKPKLDSDGILHWPVLFLYVDAMSSDFVEDFLETDTFAPHIDMMYSEYGSLPWDSESVYTREAIELYYEVTSEPVLSRKEVLRYMLEGTAGANAQSSDDDEKNADVHEQYASGPLRWIKVNEQKTLHDVLRQSKLVIPGIPAFYVISTRSHIYKEFISGKWRPTL